MTQRLPRKNHHTGFTLIEISIVLIIIGLIVGGILTGRELISAAEVRAQISQIEKYQQAVNTFQGKYGYLPGDIREPNASNFGFLARGTSPGQGDGNGVLTAHDPNDPNVYAVPRVMFGENGMFWVDLSTARLVDGAFNTATPTQAFAAVVGTTLNRYLPQAKMGGYVTAWSGGYNLFYSGDATFSDNVNYFSVEGTVGTDSSGFPRNVPSMTVAQARSIDAKVDDGLPQFGRVMAFDSWYWAGWTGQYDSSGGMTYRKYGGDSEGMYGGAVLTTSNIATPASNYTCYDNGNISNTIEQYSMTTRNGQGKNCSLSFRFQ